MHYYLYKAKGLLSSLSHLGPAQLVQSDVLQDKDISTKGFKHHTSTAFLLIIVVVNLLLQLDLN